MPQTPSHSISLLLATLLAWLSLALPVAARGGAPAAPAPTPVRAEPTVAESWYQISIGEKNAGWMVERRRTGPDGNITSETETELHLSRGQTALRLFFSSSFVETSAGEPLCAESRQEMGQLPLTTRWTFGEEGILIRSGEGEGAVEKTAPLPAGPWLTPARVTGAVERWVAEGAERFGYSTLDPSLGPTLIQVAAEKMGEEEIERPGGPVRASRWHEVQRGSSTLETVVFRDSDGSVLRSETTLMGLTLTLTRVDRDRALSPAGAAPELLVPSFVRPSRPLPEPRRLRRAVYLLSARTGAMPGLPSAGAQQVGRVEGGGTRVSIDLAAGPPPRGGSSPEPAESLLVPTPYLDYKSPSVRRLLAEALGDVEAGPARQAERLRAFVHAYLVEKDLGTGFATASEVAATRSGDCTEHAVLLAALLRGAGIPARVVGGLLYVQSFAGEEEIFGYHMWSQAFLEGRWVDLDAMTLDPFDAAHIALAVSNLDGVEDLSALGGILASLIGNLEIEVVELGSGNGGRAGTIVPE